MRSRAAIVAPACQEFFKPSPGIVRITDGWEREGVRSIMSCLPRALLAIGLVFIAQGLWVGKVSAACPPGKTLDASRDLSKLVPNTANMLPDQPKTDSAPLLQAAITYAANPANGYSKVTVDAGEYFFLTTTSMYFEKPAYVEVPPKTSCLTLSFKGANFFFYATRLYRLLPCRLHVVHAARRVDRFWAHNRCRRDAAVHPLGGHGPSLSRQYDPGQHAAGYRRRHDIPDTDATPGKPSTF
jgi:hypothetical protein